MADQIDHTAEEPALVRLLGDAWIRPDAVYALTAGGVNNAVTTVYLSSGQTLTISRMVPSEVATALKIGDPS